MLAISRRVAIPLIFGVGAATGLALSTGKASSATVQPMLDYWSPLVTWQTTDNWWAAPVHVSLHQDGSLLFHGGSRSDLIWVKTSQTGTAGFRMMPGAPTPSVTATLINEPVDVNLFTAGPWNMFDNLLCAGHAHMADGSVFLAGGTRSFLNTTTSEYLAEGLSYATRATPQTWLRVTGNMVASPPGEQPLRWYPTVTRLPDGRMLVLGGATLVTPFQSPNLTVESYTPTSGTWSVLSTYGQTPSEIWNRDYTHTFVLPRTMNGADLITIGEPGIPFMHAAVTPPPWRMSPTFRPGSDAYQAIRQAQGTFWGVDGPNFGASTVMLPLRVQDGEWGYTNGSILTVGGPDGSTHAHFADIYSPASDSWHPRIDIGAPRHYPSTVLLPNGQLLIVNGVSADLGVKNAHYINLFDGLSSAPGSDPSGDLRGYHSLAMLLPDGRVLVGGGRNAAEDVNSERADFRYYYPVYMFAPRPKIVTAPQSMVIGSTFTISTQGSQPLEVVLTGLGSMTHSVDMNQRSVQLQLVSATPNGAGGFNCSVMAPTTTQLAPPGPYLMWVLDAQRTPSVAAQVMVTSGVAMVRATQATVSVVRGQRPASLPNPAQHVAQLKKRSATGLPQARVEFTCPLPARP